ncbi:MAG: phage major capsid protein [Candidatus Hadarchaeum sp.]
MGANLTTFDAALKQYYTKDRIINLVYQDNPLFALMPKSEDFYGRNLPIVLQYGNPQGRSASFARAQIRGKATSTKLDDFLLTRVKDYSIAYIDGETMKATESDMGAFLEASTTEIDAALAELTRSVAIGIYGSGYGTRGRIGAATVLASTTLVLENKDDVTNFEVGMELDVWGPAETAASKPYGTSGNGLIITGIDRVNGTLTFAFNLNDAANGIPTIAVGDFIGVRGDHNAANLSRIAGLRAWVPDVAPGSTPFFGVDRSVDVTRLGGLRLDGTGNPIEEVLIEGASLVGREGGKLTHYFMNYEKYTELQNSLGSKVQYIDMKVAAEVGFRGILINGPRGPITCVPDQNCPSGRIFGLDLSVWKLYSLGPAVQILEHDGLMLLREPNDDGVEVRCGFYGNLGCRAPGHNINIKI